MSPGALIAEQQRQLGGLAELSLAMAERLQATALATDDTREMVRLADAFAKVSRCLRMSIALSMRLARGEPMASAREARDVEVEAERDESGFLDERPEGPEHENLYDRLPSGDLPTQISAVAGALAAAARVFPAPLSKAYRARCSAIIAEAAADLAPGELRELIEQASIPTAIERAATRSRGPPRLN